MSPVAAFAHTVMLSSTPSPSSPAPGKPRLDPRVYVVTDPRVPAGRTVEQIVQQALHGDGHGRAATVIQLRDKHADRSTLYKTADNLRALTTAAGATLIINDDVALAKHCAADGVHVGQDDTSAREARSQLGQSAIVGVSAGTIDEAEQAIADGADYIGVGCVFKTATKLDAGQPIGTQTLHDIVQVVNGRVPVVAIGGVSIQNAKLCRDVGANGVAVVSAVMNADRPDTAAAALFDVWQ